MKIKICILGLLVLLISCAPVKFRENQMEYIQEIRGKVSEIKTTTIYYDDKTGEIRSSYPYIFRYNNDNQPTEEIDGREPNGIANTFYQYDAKGRLEKVTGRGKSGLYTVYEYYYDENGNNIEYISYNDQGKPYVRKQMKYDRYGNEIEELHEQYGQKIVTNFTTFSIDYNKRNSTMQTLVDGIASKNIWVQWYDKKGNPIKSEHFRDGVISNISYKKYDKKGNITEERSHNDIFTYKYRFDKKGNVIRQDAYNKDKIYYTQIFEITYFE